MAASHALQMYIPPPVFFCLKGLFLFPQSALHLWRHFVSHPRASLLIPLPLVLLLLLLLSWAGDVGELRVRLFARCSSQQWRFSLSRQAWRSRPALPWQQAILDPEAPSTSQPNPKRSIQPTPPQPRRGLLSLVPLPRAHRARNRARSRPPRRLRARIRPPALHLRQARHPRRARLAPVRASRRASRRSIGLQA